MKTTVSCIVPAYNEESTIAFVVTTALATREIDEVIVVSDGSTDQTIFALSRLQRDKLTIISLRKNGGKAGAVKEGLKYAHGDIVLLLDADLVGLKPHHIARLLEPVLKKPDTVSFAFLGNAPGIARLLGINVVSGQRAFPRHFMKVLEKQNTRGYLLEIALNQEFLRQNVAIHSVQWMDVRHRKKMEKRGVWNGWWSDFYMTWSILFALGPIGIVQQFGGIWQRKQTSSS